MAKSIDKTKIVSMRVDIPLYTQLLNDAYTNDSSLSDFVLKMIKEHDNLELLNDEVQRTLDLVHRLSSEKEKQSEIIESLYKKLDKKPKEIKVDVVREVEVVKEVEVMKELFFVDEKEVTKLKDIVKFRNESIKELNQRVSKANEFIKDKHASEIFPGPLKQF
jgi:predicted RNase H-like nuclease (RuvC/YqgF family)